MRKKRGSSLKSCIKIDQITGCWIWLAGKSNGYGYAQINGKTRLVHKFLYEEKYGKVIPTLVLDHIICNNRDCVNPDHLKPVSHGDNCTRDNNGTTAINKQKTHCKRGHEFNENNTLIIDYGDRRERECVECLITIHGWKTAKPGVVIRGQ